MSHHLISLMVFLPLSGAFFQLFLPNARSRWIALAGSLAASICGLILVFSVHKQTADLQATESFSWVGAYAIRYEMGVDGFNILMILLISLLFPILISAEWNQKIGQKGMHGLFLILQTSLFGTVCAQDLFLQFFFWSLSALPFYFLVGIWGEQGRERAAFRSIVSASLGNIFIFLALILIYYAVDPPSFSLKELVGSKLVGKSFHLFGNTFPVTEVAFILMSFGLSLRAPIWPLHGWFTEVAQEAPFSVLVALVSATVPVSIYVFIRVCYLLFPAVLIQAAPITVCVGCMNLIMGGLCAVTQKNLRRLLAFLCLGQVGFVLIGIGSLSPIGFVGAVYSQVVFGLELAGFGLFASLISERFGTSSFLCHEGKNTFGGLAMKAPAISVTAGLIIASLLGFPGLGGFVGNSLVMIGSYSMYPVTLLIAGGSLLLSVFTLFSMYRCIFLGSPLEGSSSPFQDLILRERIYLFPIVAALLCFGFYPKPFLELIRPTILTFLSSFK